GGFIFSDSYAYLDLSFNRNKNRILKIHLVPEFGEDSLTLALYAGKSTKKAYEKWISTKWSKRPDLPLYSSPSEELIRKPIWTTWALYKWAIDREKVINFADSILSKGLPISYLEIDDRWTKKYGDLDFDVDRFPDAKGMIDYLHHRGIKVSLWVPPFVNQDAETFEDGVKNKAFMASYNSRYPALVGWWNTANIENAGIIDFFTERGRDWFGAKIRYLIEKYGIDGFKYDAGEAQFVPLKPRLESGLHPNMYSDYYARWGLAHRGVEMRAGYFAQNLPILFRQFDKASHWGFNNGLASVMTQILAMGIVGYPFVLPDMIGGNEYLNKATEELYIRWVELNSFLPYMQFSIPPFRDDYSGKVMEITRKYLALREKIIPEIIRASREAAITQIPIVRPLFFEFEDDEFSYSIEDEFMIGSKYLVAPVIREGALDRKIYFPPAKFRSIHNTDEVIEGPKIIEDYPAPLDIIPVFERID
ncbi:MAG: glycoside hydrolase family 31 protein, partial [Deltaproteobacteria bacterium]|nr:glycoside hydrolase family 31 protein [Deltaproteobacteria bacterium]